eukprot:gb/GEZN01009157.1/.p1 GENE.gb/GEZN01009157.1/~~gb/GEZN01009157.1/.p1  ORF type:complete len:434 (+),score=18.91 gb/GEZN01009157.1/:53-1354(+)
MFVCLAVFLLQLSSQIRLVLSDLHTRHSPHWEIELQNPQSCVNVHPHLLNPRVLRFLDEGQPRCQPRYSWSCMKTRIPVTATPRLVYFCLQCCYQYWLAQLGYDMSGPPVLEFRELVHSTLYPAKGRKCVQKPCSLLFWIDPQGKQNFDWQRDFKPKLLTPAKDDFNSNASFLVTSTDWDHTFRLGQTFLPESFPTVNLSARLITRNQRLLDDSPQILGIYSVNLHPAHQASRDWDGNSEENHAHLFRHPKLRAWAWGLSPNAVDLTRCGDPLFHIVHNRSILFNCKGVAIDHGHDDRKRMMQKIPGRFGEDCRNSVEYLDIGQYGQRLMNSKFTFSGPGHGIQCYRTWETLYCGGIPVVLDVPWEQELYEDLPVLRLTFDQFADITPSYLEEAWRAFKISHDQFNMAKVYQPYWVHELYSHFVQDDRVIPFQ